MDRVAPSQVERKRKHFQENRMSSRRGSVGVALPGLQKDCFRQRKMAGREDGPARKKVITFRGEHRSEEWEETSNDVFMLSPFSRAGDE
ncbi:hypothetical protein FJ959_23485 [Mesorhizobium sp. B2-2-4]|uniref:hypothetical protein n=1 Tax=unclassified Mesorhizobium TaxID=325217 RepID=UPI00112C1775|nr:MULTISPECIES: hypothetical protein [unclassified Mesorhizobium]TPM52349.1 hypothetical protein FJ959_23485 [Mesorhizobium sp. B2-2-4]TPM61337.1 hypothetical protein FJ965_22915 [Mesorhizobium sp. B2-2-1]TPN61351.1 hypothetical protein FJ984_27990 [Mesorhizobium sp. B1-1-3]